MSRDDNFVENIIKCEVSEVKKFLAEEFHEKRVINNGEFSVLLISLRKIVEIEKSEKKLLETNEENEKLDELEILKSRQIDIHELLLSHGLTFALSEDSNVEFNLLETSTKIKLNQIQKKFHKDASLKHLSMLISKSKLSHDTVDSLRSKLSQIVVRSFEELNRVKWLEPILKTTAYASKLKKIIFAFNHNSVENIDPTSKKNVHGMAYTDDGDILIGAQNLLKENQRFEVLGHLIHELTHFAMEIIYQNNANPYIKSDKVKNRFEEILKICEDKKSQDNIIGLVFLYGKSSRHAELIVRVPHLLAFNINNNKKIDEVKTNFHELFEFFENKTLNDLENESSLIESKYLVEKLNQKSELSSKLKASDVFFEGKALNFNFNPKGISFVSSNCPRLTIKLIHQQFKESELISMKVESILRNQIFILIVEAMTSKLKPILMIDCENEKSEKIALVLENLRLKEINERIVIIQSDDDKSIIPNPFFRIEIKQSWNQFTRKTQEKLMKTFVHFQGFPLSLDEIISSRSDALRSIPLQNLLTENLKIGQKFEVNSSDFYIQREFLDVDDVESVFLKEIALVESSDLIELNRKEKILLLSGSPGIGKTTEMKMMTKRIKEKFPSLWVEYVELRKFVSVFERDGKVLKTFKSNEEVSEFLCEKILRIEGFNAKVFSELYNSNSVVLLFDGFDEISPSFKQFNLNLIKSIQGLTKNQLWISTRSHLHQELKKLLKCRSFTLQPIEGIFDKRVVIEQMLKRKGFDGSLLEEKVRLMQNFMRWPEFQDIFNFSSPMMIGILADIIKDLEGFIPTPNLYFIYKSFIYKIVENFIRKGSEAENDIAEIFIHSTDVMAFHQRKAVENIFENEFSKEMIFTESEILPTEKLARFGLLLSDSSHLKFVYPKFEEFFVVDFFFNNFSYIIKFSSQNPRSKSIINLLSKVLIEPDERFELIKNFFEGLFANLILKNHKKVKIVKRIFKENFSIEDLSFLFYESVERGFMNTIKMISVGDKTMNKSDLKKLWLGKLRDQNVLLIAVKNQTFEFTEELLSFAQNVLDQEDLEKLFFDENEEGESLLSSAFQNSNETFLYFVNHPIYSFKNLKTKKLFLSSCGTKISSKSVFGNLLTHAFIQRDRDEVLVMIQLIEQQFSSDEIECILTDLDANSRNILFWLSAIIRKSGRTVLHLLQKHLTANKLREMVLSKDNYGITPLMSSVDLRDEKTFEVLWDYLKDLFNNEEEFKSNLLEEDHNQLTALTHSLVDGNDLWNSKFVLNVYKTYFSVETIRKIISKGRYFINNSINV